MNVAENSGNLDKDRFLYPIGRYYGQFTPEQLAFNANLQEFAQRVSIICGLETGGKIPPGAAYEQIKELWNDLKESKRNLIDGQEDTHPPENP
nr:hypothetical protein [Leptolyngbya sp. 'hensonii']